MDERPRPRETDCSPFGAIPAEAASSGIGSLPHIRQLVLDHYASVYRYAFRLSGRADDAEDLTQQTFMIAQRKLHQLREVDKAVRWLFAILRSAYLKSVRKQRPLAAVNLDLDVNSVPDRGVQRDWPEEIDPDALQAALEEMPDEFKLVLLMFYFEDRSYKEIAGALEIPIGTVMSRLSRAKERLRQRLFPTVSNNAKARERDLRLRPAATHVSRE